MKKYIAVLLIAVVSLCSFKWEKPAATPEEASRRIRSEIANWGKVIADANIRIE